MVISGPRKQEATFGVTAAGFVTLFDWLVVRHRAVLQESCVQSEVTIPTWVGAQRHCYVYFFE